MMRRGRWGVVMIKYRSASKMVTVLGKHGDYRMDSKGKERKGGILKGV